MGMKKTFFELEDFVKKNGRVIRERIQGIQVVPTNSVRTLNNLREILQLNIKNLKVVVHKGVSEFFETTPPTQDDLVMPFSTTFVMPKNVGYTHRVPYSQFLSKCIKIGFKTVSPEKVLQVCAFQPFANGGMSTLVGMDPVGNKILRLENDWEKQQFSVDSIGTIGPHQSVMLITP